MKRASKRGAARIGHLAAPFDAVPPAVNRAPVRIVAFLLEV